MTQVSDPSRSSLTLPTHSITDSPHFLLVARTVQFDSAFSSRAYVDQHIQRLDLLLDTTITKLFTMFKWNKVKVSSGEPTTPRVALANLPDADSWRGSPIPKISTAGKSLKHSLGRLTPDQRMETPHLIVIPSHRDKTHVSRPRTMSLLKHDEGQVPL